MPENHTKFDRVEGADDTSIAIDEDIAGDHLLAERERLSVRTSTRYREALRSLFGAHIVAPLLAGLAGFRGMGAPGAAIGAMDCCCPTVDGVRRC